MLDYHTPDNNTLVRKINIFSYNQLNNRPHPSGFGHFGCVSVCACLHVFACQLMPQFLKMPYQSGSLTSTKKTSLGWMPSQNEMINKSEDGIYSTERKGALMGTWTCCIQMLNHNVVTNGAGARENGWIWVFAWLLRQPQHQRDLPRLTQDDCPARLLWCRLTIRPIKENQCGENRK